MTLKLAASALLFDETGRVLLIHENYGRYRWGPPGGQVEEGETPWLAAVRETREGPTSTLPSTTPSASISSPPISRS